MAQQPEQQHEALPSSTIRQMPSPTQGLVAGCTENEGSEKMSNITLAMQIATIEEFISGHGARDNLRAILASLKRLQAAEGQEAVGVWWQFHNEGVSIGKKLPWFSDRGGYSSGKLYALPPDAQGMIDKLTAERDALRKQLAQGEAVAWLHEVVFADDGENDQALSFSKDSFPFDGVAGYRSKNAVPLYTAPPAKPVSERLHLEEPTRSQFLSDVHTAAGLIRHGQQSKALSDRLSDYWRLEMNAAVEDTRAALNQPAKPAVSSCAEEYLINKYGACRGSHSWRVEAEAFEAGQASAKPAIPEGFAIVPIEPTEEILNVLYDCPKFDADDAHLRATWVKVIAAAKGGE